MIVRTGDAQVEVWLEASGGRSYCCTVESRRLGKFESERWKRPVFYWSVETWLNEEKPEPGTARSLAFTFASAMREARREADRREAKYHARAAATMQRRPGAR